MKLATKLVIAMLVFAMTAATIGTAFSSGTIKKALEGNISKSQALETDQVMDKIDRFLYERTVDIQLVTERDQFEEYLQLPSSRNKENSKRLVAQFNDFRIASGVWGDMTLLDTNGQVLITTDGPEQISNLITQSSFKQTFEIARSGQSASSDVFLEADGKNPIELFMAPVRAQTAGKPIIGVVVGELAWSAVLQVLGNPGDNVTAHLLNKDGYVLGSSNGDEDRDEILVKKVADSRVFKASTANQSNENRSNIFPSIDDPDIQVLSTYEHERGYLSYKGNDWLLILETPTSIAFTPATNLARKMIISSVAITFLALIALLWYTYRSVIQPIRQLHKAISKIIGGNLHGRVKYHARDEVGELGQAFNKMAQGLEETEHKLQEEHARLTASINSLEVGFLMTDLNNEIVTINSSARKLLSNTYQADESAWKFSKVADLLAGSVDLSEVLKLCLESWQVSNLKEVDFDNKVLHIFAGPILTRLADGKVSVIGCVVLFEDITESIVQARSKDEFFSIASHELRTPLTSIRGNSSMMTEYYADVLKDPVLKEMIGDIHESSTRLIEIVNDFLDVSRIEQGKIKFTFRDVALDEITEKIVYEMRAVLKEKNLYLNMQPKTLGILPHVAGDCDRVKQIIYNLIGNAVKFTEEGGVTVSAIQEKDMVKVSVTDTGRGISPDGQKLLFRKFQQAGDSLFTRDTTKGTGLGLYISKLLVEGMGGKITLENSVEGKGSTFAFTLPVATKELIESLQTMAAQKGLIDSKTGMTQADASDTAGNKPDINPKIGILASDVV